MPELIFQVLGVRAEPFAVSPLLVFTLRVANADPDESIHTVMLRCQIQIEPSRRQYAPEERPRLLDLFGEPERWSRTLKTLLWTHATVSITAFSGATEVDLPVPCTYDFNVAAAKYFHALEDGEAPLTFLFSGTVFYAADDGALQVAQISWSAEAGFRLPVRVWQEMMELYYPNSAWLVLRKDVMARLVEYKVRRGALTWEEAIASLLPAPEAVAER